KNVITRSLGPDPNVEVDIEGPLAVQSEDVYLLCSDGLSGPVSDPELGAFAENFHPKDSCRYLLNLANLRGGFDNITVMILRLGDWIEPATADDLPIPPRVASEVDGKAGKGWLSRLLPGRRQRETAATVEDHPYRTAACPIDDDLLERLADLTRKAQQHAIDHAWPIDWTAFAAFRRAESESREAKNPRKTLMALGEMVVSLGQAARFHRKAGGHAGVS
ncbi:MAG: PP2C family serine/threonine-protein phosphatase, partial [Isosphaeraceae bacterium]